MNVRIILLTTVLFIALFEPVLAQKNELNRQTTPLKIDGSDEDCNSIGGNLRFYDSGSKINFDVRNDSANLYLIFKSDDKFLQHQISLAGMTLKLSVKEKKKRTATFTIKEKNKDPERFSRQSEGVSLDDYALKEEYMPKDTAWLQGFHFTNGKLLSRNRSSKEFSFDIRKGEKASGTIVEILIPIRELFGNDYSLKEISKIPLQFQLTINSFSSNSNYGQMKVGMGREGGLSGNRRMRGSGSGGESRLSGRNNGEIPNGAEMNEGQNSRHQKMWGTNSNEKKEFKFDFYLTD